MRVGCVRTHSVCALAIRPARVRRAARGTIMFASANRTPSPDFPPDSSRTIDRMRQLRLSFFGLVEINKLGYVCLPAGRPAARESDAYIWMHGCTYMQHSYRRHSSLHDQVIMLRAHDDKTCFFFVKFKGKFPCGRLNLIRSRQRARHAGLNLTKGCLISCMK